MHGSLFTLDATDAEENRIEDRYDDQCQDGCEGESEHYRNRHRNVESIEDQRRHAKYGGRRGHHDRSHAAYRGVKNRRILVLTLADFRNGTESWFHSYLWGRFAQRCGLVFSRDELVTDQVLASLACSVTTFIVRTLPQMESSFSTRDLWARGLYLSYRSELRTEQADGSARLFDNDPEYYQELTRVAIASAPFAVSVKPGETPCLYQTKISSKERLYSLISWRVRALQGKILSALRLIKGSLTFEGGVEYILWKIKRHSGVTLEVSPFLRRHPLLAMCLLSWRLFRRGGIQ